ncbi:hypothetical protein EVA_03765 [gut metagenome]|uniref:5'-3' exonuclease alpha-helical arch N-terminal domain-containing protein n=1 Tax=gut metagenome TaxID=749906 RepID=J9GK49_9ZZZZ
MKKLYLLDAYALIYRAYYALIRSPRINSKGEKHIGHLWFCQHARGYSEEGTTRFDRHCLRPCR